MNGQRGVEALRAGYHGTGGGLFFVVMKNLLLTVLTLGVYLPWARTERRKYLWQNISFDGHRLRYHGTGRELLIGYVKVIAAYAVFLVLPAIISRSDAVLGAIAQAVGVILVLPLIPIAIYGARRYLLGRTSLRGVRFGLEPGAGGFFKVAALGYALTLMTMGFYGPIWQNRMYRYMMERTRYGTEAFSYDGSDNEAFKIGVRGFFLSLFTLGLYYPWYAAQMARFRAEHTMIQGARGRLDLSGGDMFWMLAASIFGTILTLGLAFPWVMTYVFRTYCSKLSFVGAIDYARIERRAATGDATADGLADALDVGLEI